MGAELYSLLPPPHRNNNNNDLTQVNSADPLMQLMMMHPKTHNMCDSSVTPSTRVWYSNAIPIVVGSRAIEINLTVRLPPGIEWRSICLSSPLSGPSRSLPFFSHVPSPCRLCQRMWGKSVAPLAFVTRIMNSYPPQVSGDHISLPIHDLL